MELDKKKIAEELGIPEDMYQEILQDFSSQAESVLQQLQTAIEAKNFQQIAEQGHFIKGSAGAVKAESLYAIAKEIEACAKEKKDLALIQAQVENFRSAFEELKKVI